ncbi:bifunctional riboflavin kinase/FAD synthetase [Chelativorans sp. Marseille-P2723]|uniref:bifunctional riboflavin kinase/FAD synthetase n=1 Tax=Chelativorans sp. Marseille-P2723 TaxID=2709133 RepID=UPI0015712605|nr:bifunctional riboflavin kinase/FAD synthetase [Chelativorans sp. Marseille-P2723]
MEGFRRCIGLDDFPAALRGGVVAIGNFDGVHRGHQTVLSNARKLARKEDLPAVVLTFEPHPRSIFQPQAPVFRLTPASLKARLIAALGFDAVVEQPFTRHFSQIAPDDFVAAVLMEGLGARHVVTGQNFHYGKNRGGTPDALAQAGSARGFGVSVVEAFCDESGGIVSSTRVRAGLAQGNVSQAAALLGYRFTVEAEVVRGKQLGRTLGFPTANMALPNEVTLRHGIYAVRFRRADGRLHDGVASFGRRPTVDEAGQPLLETFIFDLNADLYGETCSVSFFGFLREEEKFEGLDAMAAQMQRDQAEARALLSGIRPLSELDLAIAF